MRNSVLCYLEDIVRKFPDKIALTDKKWKLLSDNGKKWHCAWRML